MSAEADVQGHGAVRIVGLATSEAVTGDREDACSISAVGDNGVSFRRLQRCCEWCRERRDMCLSVRIRPSGWCLTFTQHTIHFGQVLPGSLMPPNQRGKQRTAPDNDDATQATTQDSRWRAGV